MSQNPLLGKRISLISKKNIRYEGLLYSINEQNATVALQNVRSYGTEGRERELQTDDNATMTEKFVPPNDAIHPYLLFRGQDIKDLHVHENQNDTNAATATTGTAGDATIPSNSATSTNVASPPATATTAGPANLASVTTESAPTPSAAEPQSNTTTTAATTAALASNPITGTQPRSSTAHGSGRGGGRGGGRFSNNGNNSSESRAPRTSNSNNNNNHRSGPNSNNSRTINSATEGTGASLLARKERGTNVANDPTSTTDDFDFEQAAIRMNGPNQMGDDNDDDAIANNSTDNHQTESSPKVAYAKDDFFDSISCDAIDKQSGIDRRLRGNQERKLNSETFGAIALNSNNNRYNYRSRGGGRGSYRGGRSGGGRGRGSFQNNSENTAEGNNDSNYYNNSTGNNYARGGYRGGGRSSSNNNGGGGRGSYRGGRNTTNSGRGGGRNSGAPHEQQRPTSTPVVANAP